MAMMRHDGVVNDDDRVGEPMGDSGDGYVVLTGCVYVCLYIYMERDGERERVSGLAWC